MLVLVAVGAAKTVDALGVSVVSALSSGDFAASLPASLVQEVTALLEQIGLSESAVAVSAHAFPWREVSGEEWLLRRVKAFQVRSWARMVNESSHRTDSSDGRDEDSDGDGEHPAVKQVADRLAVEFTLTPQAATGDVRAAVGLVNHLPRILVLLEQGRLDWARARAIVTRLNNPPSSVEDFTPDCVQWRLIEAALAAQAPSLARPRLEKLINRLLLRLAPEGAHEAARAQRRTWVEPLPDGMAFFGAVLDADAAQYLMGVLDFMADAARDQAAADGIPEERTHQQRCADALAAIFTAIGLGADIPIVPTPTNPGEQDDDEETGFGKPHDRNPPSADSCSASSPSTAGPGATDPEGADARAADPGVANSDTAESGGTGSGGSDPAATDPGAADPGAADPGADPGAGTGAAGQARSKHAQEDMDDLLDEQDAAHRRDLDLFGIGPYPASEDLPTELNQAGLPVPAWWRFRELPRRKGRGPQIVLTATLEAWLGLARTPANLRGYGAVSAEQARKIGADPSHVTVLLLPGHCRHDRKPATEEPVDDQPEAPGSGARKPDSAGQAAGRTDEPTPGQECAYDQDHHSEQATRYRPSRTLTDLVTALYETCTFPHCGRPATHCDLDHLKPFGQGGSTCICNLRPACRRHHQLKTKGLWQARSSRPDEPYPTGTVVWSTSDGQEHLSEPCRPGTPNWLPDEQADPQTPHQVRMAFESGDRTDDGADDETPRPDPNRSDTSGAGKDRSGVSGCEPVKEKRTREDTMPAAERARRRRQRWQRDLRRLRGFDSRGRRSGEEDRPQREDRAQRESRQQREDRAQQHPGGPRPFNAIWPSTPGPAPDFGEPNF